MEHGGGEAASVAWLAAFHLGVCSISPLGEVVYWLSICKVLSGSFWMQDSRGGNIFHCLFCQNRINTCNISSWSRTGWNPKEWPHHMAVPTEGPGWVVVVSGSDGLLYDLFSLIPVFIHCVLYACVMHVYISIWFKTYSSKKQKNQKPTLQSCGEKERDSSPSHPIPPFAWFLPRTSSTLWLTIWFVPYECTRVSLCTYKQIQIRSLFFLLYTKARLLYRLFSTSCSSLSVQRKLSYSFYRLHSIPLFYCIEKS